MIENEYDSNIPVEKKGDEKQIKTWIFTFSRA